MEVTSTTLLLKLILGKMDIQDTDHLKLYFKVI